MHLRLLAMWFCRQPFALHSILNICFNVVAVVTPIFNEQKTLGHFSLLSDLRCKLHLSVFDVMS